MKILFIVPAMYPVGWAYASRALNLVRIMEKADHEVTVISDYLSDGVDKKENTARYEDVKIIISTGKYASERTLKDKLFISKTMKKTIENYLTIHCVDLILCPMTGGKFSMVNRIAKKKGIPIVLEVCEWYSHRNWKYGYLDPRFLKFQFEWRFILPKVTKAICISRLLDEYFLKKGVETIRIPALLSIEEQACKKQTVYHTPPKLVFVGGITGGKDELSSLIEVVCRNKLPFEVHVYGPDIGSVQKTLQKTGVVLSQYRDTIFVYGHVDQRVINHRIMDCDYGILIRPQRRSSNAGFPTKLGEYFAAGLPIIANDTGDICLYLEDGKNGILLDNNSKESIKIALDRISTIDGRCYCEMSTIARKTAEDYFDLRYYIDEMNNFLLK